MVIATLAIVEAYSAPPLHGNIEPGPTSVPPVRPALRARGGTYLSGVEVTAVASGGRSLSECGSLLPLFFRDHCAFNAIPPVSMAAASCRTPKGFARRKHRYTR